jgi:hypothetical protein
MKVATYARYSSDTMNALFLKDLADKTHCRFHGPSEGEFQ